MQKKKMWCDYKNTFFFTNEKRPNFFNAQNVTKMEQNVKTILLTDVSNLDFQLYLNCPNDAKK
jgi:hypothetical protein